MNKFRKKKKASALMGGLLSVGTIAGTVASCGAALSDGASSKRDGEGNPLAFGIHTEDGKDDSIRLDKFLNEISPKQNTTTALFTGVTNQLYRYYYDQEQKASEAFAKKYNEDSAKVDTYDKQVENSKKFFDDEKKSYQQTYREKWESYWSDHLLQSYNSKSEAQAIENRTATQIKNDALRRFQLESTGDKSKNQKWLGKDVSDHSFLDEKYNVYQNTQDSPGKPIADDKPIEIMITKSFDDSYKNPKTLLSDYLSKNTPVFLSHFLVNFKEGATADAPWALNKQSLSNMFTRPQTSFTDPILKFLVKNGLDTDTGDEISKLANRDKLIALSDNPKKDDAGALGNFVFENINSGLKPGFGIGVANGLAMIKNKEKINDINEDISYDFTDSKGDKITEKGFYAILEHAVLDALDQPSTGPSKTPPNPTSILNLSDQDISKIGSVLSKAFTPNGGTARGRSLTYKTGDGDNFVVMSADGLDFVNVDQLKNDGSSAKPETYDDPTQLIARIRNDLKRGINDQSLHFNVSNMVSDAISKGNMTNYALNKALSDPKFVAFLKNQKNYSKQDNPKFTDQDIKTVQDVIKGQDDATFVPKNGAIYKWLSDYFDESSSSYNPKIDPDQFSIENIYKYIIAHEGKK